MTENTRRMPSPELPPCGDWPSHGEALRLLGTCPNCDAGTKPANPPPPPLPPDQNLSPVRERFGLDLPPPAYQPGPKCKLCSHPAGPGGVLCPACLAYADAMGGGIPMPRKSLEPDILKALGRLADQVKKVENDRDEARRETADAIKQAAAECAAKHQAMTEREQAFLSGWRAGREAAAKWCENLSDPDASVLVPDALRDLPEPRKE